MNDLMDTIRDISAKAAAHSCSPYCPQQARGIPPRGYWEVMTRLAARLGYALERSREPADAHGPGCAGVTTGYSPVRCPGCGGNHGSGFTISITPGQVPAEEFSTVAHEFAHAFLRHSPRDAYQHLLKALQKAAGVYDKPGEEIQAELAAAAAGAACGLDTSSSICYVSGYVRQFRQVTEDDQYAALQAARAITEVMR
jgi:hypothetical protein